MPFLRARDGLELRLIAKLGQHGGHAVKTPTGGSRPLPSVRSCALLLENVPQTPGRARLHARSCALPSASPDALGPQLPLTTTAPELRRAADGVADHHSQLPQDLRRNHIRHLRLASPPYGWGACKSASARKCVVLNTTCRTCRTCTLPICKRTSPSSSACLNTTFERARATIGARNHAHFAHENLWNLPSRSPPINPYVNN